MSTLISPRSLFLASAAVCIGPAVWLLISPATLFAVYGLTLDSAGIFVGRVLGTAMVALALLFWEARDAAGTPLGALVMRAGLLHNALLVIVIVAATLAGTVTWTGWPAAALHAAFVGTYGMALRRKGKH